MTAIGMAPGAASTAAGEPPVSMDNVVPRPVTVHADPGRDHELTAYTRIVVRDERAAAIGGYLARTLRAATGFSFPVVDTADTKGIELLLEGHDGPGYTLDVDPGAVVLRAAGPEGLFHGVQTLRQLLPSGAEGEAAGPGPWPVAGGHIEDEPRFEYRSAMLDVARHFFGVADVQRYLDHLARYKMNYFHLHLSDDQGWRIAIDDWPRLATRGGSTQVGGGPGGFYTKEEYTAIVEYAAERHITVVPEIDMPGHTNGALTSYAELNCDGMAPPLYTGTDVGFSSLCVDKEITYRFVDDVVRELVALTPGPYFHIGGDEAKSTAPADYVTFVDRVQRIVRSHGKTVVGWHEIANATPLPTTVGQYWGEHTSHPQVAAAVERGLRLVMSPAKKTYLDMKYDSSTALGLDWAGHIDVRDAYDWDPASYLEDVPAAAVLGIGAPLWTETLATMADLEYMAFPRLPALAEVGWSATLDWESFRTRLAAQAPRWAALGINYYRSPQIPWG